MRAFQSPYEWQDQYPGYMGPEALGLVVGLCRAFHDYQPNVVGLIGPDDFLGLRWWEVPVETFWHHRMSFGGQKTGAVVRYLPGLLVHTFAFPPLGGLSDMWDAAAFALYQGEVPIELRSWTLGQYDAVIDYVQFFLNCYQDEEDEPLSVLTKIKEWRSIVEREGVLPLENGLPEDCLAQARRSPPYVLSSEDLGIMHLDGPPPYMDTLRGEWQMKYPEFYGPDAIALIVDICFASHGFDPPVIGWPDDPFNGRYWWELRAEEVCGNMESIKAQPFRAILRYLPALLVHTFSQAPHYGGREMLGGTLNLFRTERAAHQLDAFPSTLVDATISYFRYCAVLWPEAAEECHRVADVLTMMRTEAKSRA